MWETLAILGGAMATVAGVLAIYLTVSLFNGVDIFGDLEK